MPNAFISGVGFNPASNVVKNDDLRTKYGMETDHEWIVKRTGIEERRFADEGIGPADLAVAASQDAIAKAGIKVTDIDLILFATLSPEMAFPGSGVLLQRKLGLCDAGKFIPAMDIRNQCSGFLYGLATANAFVRSGGAKHVLVVGGEVHSAALDLSTRGRTVSSLFGDAAGAVVVSATDEDRGIRGTWLGADGRHAEVLCQRVWDMTKRPYVPLNADGNGVVVPEMLYAKMDGKLVFRHAVERMITVLMQACWEHKLTPNDIDLFCFHQANLRINEYIAGQMGLPPEKVVSNIQRFGNTTAATIPSLLFEAERDGKLKPGMKVACVAFGSGFTWGCALIDW